LLYSKLRDNSTTATMTGGLTLDQAEIGKEKLSSD
jgi:hypothetical protein